MQKPQTWLPIEKYVPLFLSAVALMIMPFLLFWQVWVPDPSRRLVFEFGDFVEQHLAMRAFVASELGAGRLPLWDPYAFAGQPALADSLLATFYPPGWWQLLFPLLLGETLPLWALQGEAITHLALGGLFTLLFVRRLTGSTGAGLLAGTAFSLSGWATSYPMLQLIILESAIWLPAALLVLEGAFARRSLWRVGLVGLIYGIALLAGHPQTFLYIAYLSAAWFFFRAWQLKVGWPFALAAALWLGTVVLGTSAAQWLPSLQMYGYSPRFGLSYEEVAHGFALSELWGVLRPNPGEWSPLYGGVLPLALAVAALVLRRRAAVAFWGAVLLIALLLSLGENGPLYPLAYRIAPGFSVFRDQERIAFLFTFALSILAGYGYATMVSKWPGIARVLPMLVLILFLDLFRANNGIILQPPPEGGYFAHTPIVQHLQTTGEPTWRVSSEGLLPGGANAGMVFHVRDVVGSGPLYIAALDEFTDAVPELRWWQMLNVQHLLTSRTIEHGALLPVLAEGDTQLYQVFVEGRATWIAHNVEVVADQDTAIRRTAAPDLDPMQTAILEEPPHPLPAPSSGSEQVTITDFDHQRLITEVELSAPGILVLSEIDYPGWKAYINGEEAPILRAYGLLRAVALPAGHSRIEWRFQPTIVIAGLLISALTLLALSLVALWEYRRRGGTEHSA